MRNHGGGSMGMGAMKHGFCRFWVRDSDAAKSRGIAPSVAVMADAYLALPQRLPSQDAAGIDMSTHLKMTWANQIGG